MATLGFSTQWPKHMSSKPTNFIPKIWAGLVINNDLHYAHLDDIWLNAEGLPDVANIFPTPEEVHNGIPKVHTIRTDEKNLWKPGRKIHMVVFNRSKNRFQFAPVLEVKTIQKIEIKWSEHNGLHATIVIDGCTVGIHTIRRLAVNDGFDSVEHFFKWFNKKFTGKIIHWTNLKY